MNHIYFTVGLSGCGKSYWCDNHAQENDVILDSDMIRAELWGDASDQQNPFKVFNLMFNRACIALSYGRDVYYCQTGLTMKHRIRFIKDIRAKYTPDQVQLHCVILVAPVEVCKERNAKRSRHVPEEVIDRQVRQFQIPVSNEGWDTIEVVISDTYDVEKLWKDIRSFGSQDNPHHTLSLYEHLRECINNVDLNNVSLGEAKDLLMAAGLHDIGKVYTRSYDSTNIAHYYGHEAYSAYLALGMNVSIRVAQLICYHMIPYMDERAQNTWKNRLGNEIYRMIKILHEADKAAH